MNDLANHSGSGLDRDQLLAQVRLAFSEHGALVDTVAEFRPRVGQETMAQAVAEAIADNAALVVEAGTGIGKTYAYLVPALLSGERILVSTATKALQDQLFSRDVPRLVAALGLPVRIALLKGRANYLCSYRLELAYQDGAANDPVIRHALGRISTWAQATRTGDFAELPGLDDRSPVLPMVSSTRDNCLGSQCPQFRSCHVNAARREALAADVVVINHHLFFADLAVRESGVAELLPSVRVAIFDEAHQLNEIGIQFLGAQLSTAQVVEFARDLLMAGLQHARGLQPWSDLAAATERSARDLRLAVGSRTGSTRLRWNGQAPEGLDGPQWQAGLEKIADCCAKAAVAADAVAELAPDFARLLERAQALEQRAKAFSAKAQVGAVRWLDVGQHLRLVEAPMDIAATMEKCVQPAGDAASRSFIFTSATLGAEPKLRWFTQPCGLGSARVLQVPSPFDYPNQAALYIPTDIPMPNDAGHSVAVARLAGQSAQLLGGATLVLTTTNRALYAIAQTLREVAQQQPALELLVQGEAPKAQIMERFRRGKAQGEVGCILVATASFWEGFDVPGDALQLVLIDKLPFPPPGDPLVEARLQKIEREGGSGFSDYSLVEAAIALKQGAGRLIRREDDNGVLVVCDRRMASMGYGRRLRAALPPMAHLASGQDYWDRLAQLATRSSTTAY